MPLSKQQIAVLLAEKKKNGQITSNNSNPMKNSMGSGMPLYQPQKTSLPNFSSIKATKLPKIESFQEPKMNKFPNIFGKMKKPKY